ncbi:helix-turn-helix domain-containing protein [Hymenobacter jeollabukensis]|uniref:Helix-turn-helix transcriptional regulator n=1 Tax=Hymenobacter jeollabukensis TaxID=2025313 RepID=A0A5R8WLF9_9BACT|nr:AraC family transcriptional regulator [Hymenobacter jeollabukensis]TLM89615.1 helix-turn-helix transcriptional regulator [Hymenobacter jeollabukensis]
MKQPNLDQWTTGFALVAFLGLFVAPLLYLQAGRRHTPVGYVAAILTLFSLTLLYYVLWWSGYLQYFPYLNGGVELFTLLFGPLFYLYLRRLAAPAGQGPASRAHWLPFAVGTLLSLPWLLTPPLQRPQLVRSGRFFALFHQALPWLALALLLGYGGALLRLRPAFGAGHPAARWARWLTTCYWGFVLANGSYYVLVQLPFFSRSWDYAISLAMSAFIFLVAVLAFVQPQVFQPVAEPAQPVQAALDTPATEAADLVAANATEEETPPTEPARYQHSGLPPRVAQEQARRLQQLMQQERLYRRPELRLDTLAEHLGLSRHHLSQVLNEQLGLNFFEYLNALRVAEAQELLRATSRRQRNIIEVAYAVGFNNKVSFNKAFKQATGLTPSEFRQQLTVNTDGDLPFPLTSGLEKG